MYVDEKDISIMEEYIPNVRELISQGSVNDVLEAIDDVIIDDILNHGDEPSETGMVLQLVYDRIFRDNS